MKGRTLREERRIGDRWGAWQGREEGQWCCLIVECDKVGRTDNGDSMGWAYKNWTNAQCHHRHHNMGAGVGLSVCPVLVDKCSGIIDIRQLIWIFSTQLME